MDRHTKQTFITAFKLKVYYGSATALNPNKSGPPSSRTTNALPVLMVGRFFTPHSSFPIVPPSDRQPLRKLPLVGVDGAKHPGKNRGGEINAVVVLVLLCGLRWFRWFRVLRSAAGRVSGGCVVRCTLSRVWFWWRGSFPVLRQVGSLRCGRVGWGCQCSAVRWVVVGAFRFQLCVSLVGVASGGPLFTPSFQDRIIQFREAVCISQHCQTIRGG